MTPEQLLDVGIKSIPEIVQDAAALSVPLGEFDFNQHNSFQIAAEIELDLHEAMAKYNGIGLANNQIGGDSRVIAIKGVGVMFNPRIISLSPTQNVMEEGCLSFPHLYVKVKRPIGLRLRFEDANGVTHTEKYAGLTARVIQHEVDHLNGILFYNLASRFHREQAFRKRERQLRRVAGD